MGGGNRRKPSPLHVPEQTSAGFQVNEAGIFSDGELSISRDGLQMGSTPANNAGTPTMQDTSHTPSVSSRPSSGPHSDTGQDRTAFDVGDERPSSSDRTSLLAHDADGALVYRSLREIKILNTIGSGSSGVVHKAEHLPTKTIVAMKVIQLNLDDQARKNIMTELKTLCKSVCRNILPIHNAFYVDGHIRIILEYMDAGSLADVARANGCIPESYIPLIAEQLLCGLDYLHRTLHVVHRDVKPSNFLVNREGVVKLSDFGVSSELANSVAKCASWVGTVTYMSPERIIGKTYGFDSDIWSLGLSLLEVAMGRFPYRAESSQQSLSFWDLLDHIVEQPPPTLSTSAGYSADFCSFIGQCLQKQPSARQTARDMLKHPFITSPRREEANCRLSDIIPGV